VRIRAVTVSALLIAVVVGTLGFAPVPFRTRAEGVVWIPEEAFARAATDGFVDRVAAEPGSSVRAGDILIVCDDPVLRSEIEVLEAQLQEIEARIREQVVQDLVKMQIHEQQRVYVQKRLARARERLADLVIVSKTGGTFVLPRADDLPGRFTKKGEVLAYVVDLDLITVRTVVDQTSIDLIRHDTQAVEVRLAERIAETIPAAVKRFVPSASEEIPSPALGSEGGGTVPLDPHDPEGKTAVNKIFQVDLELPSREGIVNVGGRVYVRFDHGRQPLAVQWYRQLRQLFLARYHV
jgi:putative peptide zinc metalloprotease protein